MLKSKIIYFSSMIIIFCVCCKRPKQTFTFNCETVKNLIERDQEFRAKKTISPVLYFLDSLLVDGGVDGGIDGMASLDGTTRKNYLEKAEYLKDNMKPPLQGTLDSIWTLQNLLDFENTEMLLDMVMSHEKTVFDTLPYKCGREAFIIFVHTPEELKEKVEKAIAHINLKSIDEAQYNHIMWHIRGRPNQNN